MVPEAKPHGTLTSDWDLPLRASTQDQIEARTHVRDTLGCNNSLMTDLVPQPALLLLLLRVSRASCVVLRCCSFN